jgi:hypothetical protein
VGRGGASELTDGALCSNTQGIPHVGEGWWHYPRETLAANGDLGTTLVAWASRGQRHHRPPAAAATREQEQDTMKAARPDAAGSAAATTTRHPDTDRRQRPEL